MFIGLKHQTVLSVTEHLAVDFMGSNAARVLGTAHMIYQLEITARDSVLPYLAPGQDTVGTYVEIHHCAATPIGMRATFNSELIEIEGRRLRFKVAAHDEAEEISYGIHERAIIDVARFSSKVLGKSTR